MRDGDLKRCGRCVFWIIQNNRCSLLGPKIPVLAEQVCGLYVHGNPMASDIIYYAALDPRVVGLGPGNTACGNCRYGGGRACGHPHLSGFPIDNKGGCCNAWVKTSGPAQVQAEIEAIEAAFDPAKHPRDTHGKFLSTGAERIGDAQNNDSKAEYHEYGPGHSSEQFTAAHPAIQELLAQDEGRSSAENEIIVALSEEHNNRVVITRGDQLVSVVSWHEYPGRSVVVQHLGSVAKGGGTKGILAATKAALQLDVPLRFQSTPEAVGFYDKMGFTPDPSRPRENAWYKTSPEGLEAVVGKTLGPKKESSVPLRESEEEDAAQRAADKVRAWLNRRVDDGALGIARLYRANRDKLLQRIQEIYTRYLGEEPSIVRARQVGATDALDRLVHQHVDDLASEVGRASVDSLTALTAAQPSIINRWIAPVLGLSDVAELTEPKATVLDELTTAVIGGGTYQDRLTNLSQGLKDDIFGAIRGSLVAGSDFETLQGKLMSLYGIDNLEEPKGNAYGSVNIYGNEARRQWNDLMQDFGDEQGKTTVWYAYLDESTTPGCAARHGIPLDELDDSPPRHYNCRCEILVVDDEADLAGMQAEADAWLKSQGYTREQAYLDESWKPLREAYDPSQHPRDEQGRFILYHGTTASDAQKIRQSGLQPTDPENWTLTTHRDKAETYANIRAKQKGGSPEVLTFKLTPEQAKKLLYKPLRSEIPLVDPKLGGYMYNYSVRQVVPPKHIESVKESGTSAGAKAGWENRLRKVEVPEQYKQVNEWIEKAGAVFGGLQEIPGGGGNGVLFTDIVTGSTMMAKPGDVSEKFIKDKVDAKRAEFAQYKTESARPYWGKHRLAFMADDVESSKDPLYGYSSVKLSELPEFATRGGKLKWAESLATARRMAEPDSIPLKAPMRFILQKSFVSCRHTEVLTGEGWQPIRGKGKYIEVSPGKYVLDGPTRAAWTTKLEKPSRNAILRYPALDALTVRAPKRDEAFRVCAADEGLARYHSLLGYTANDGDNAPVPWQEHRRFSTAVDRALKSPGTHLLVWKGPAGATEQPVASQLEAVMELETGKVLYAREHFPPGLEPVRYRMAVLCPEDGKVWAVRPRDSRSWFLPGGHKEPGETRSATAVRETLEETGLKVALEGVLGEIHRPEFTTVVFLGRKLGQVAPTAPDEIAEIALIDPGALDISERYWTKANFPH